MGIRTMALLFGVVFLAVGALGFVPGAVTPTEHPPGMTMTQGYGMLLGLFAVNLLHNVAHLLFGVWGVLSRGSAGAARNFFRGVAVIYALLTAMGLIAATSTTFGLIPLHGNNVWLHGVLALAGAYFGWMHREGSAA
ncbi:DUF4383 domain-containing protein [Sphingosinicella sp.]|uniref:DUF4383 domain-containing protein n=1 Tax=Sphingosinicella sp. TaxID=1917971 RepID=UPI004038221F